MSQLIPGHRRWSASAPFVSSFVAVCLLTANARAGTVTLGSSSVSDDTMVNSRFPNNNFGLGVSMFTGTDSGAGGPGIGQMHSLIRFTMPAALQNKVTVTHVALNLVLYAPGGTLIPVAPATPVPIVAATIALQPINVTWVEGGASLTATGNGSGTISGAPVVGVACSTGATWNRSACGAGTPWAGVTTDGTTSGTASTSGKFSGDTLVWDSGSGGNAGMITAVQSWINSPGGNFGWRLSSSTEGAVGQQLQRFATRNSGNPPSLTIDYTTCTAAANSACATGQTNNFCNDPGGFSSTYTCTCNHRDVNNNLAYTGTGTTSCTDLNDCAGNPCAANGDSTATCTDAVAPLGGHSCGCTAGFVSNGTTCIAGCNNAAPAPQPCGNGGTCNTADGGNTWTCSGCNTGFVSNGASRAACVDFNACDGTAKANCNDSQSGNACVDDAAPALTYHCTCTNPAYVLGTVGGKSACVDKNECVPNNCQASGDNFAQCIDHAAPATGFDCQCSSSLWQVTAGGGGPTCVDTNECLAPSPGPCLHGACTNITNGGGYSCMCDSGFVEMNASTPTPTCVHPNSCGTPSSDLACVTAQVGNTCVDNPPPAIGFNCQCGNSAYVRSVDGRSCIDKNDCAVNHCADGGDTRADCHDRKAPKSGFDCDCSPGFAFDGATCSDIDECTGGPNPCGAHGTCTNAKGGYSCACDSGYALSSVSNAAVCVSKSNTAISYTVSAGSGCSVGGAETQSTALFMLLMGALLLVRRRRWR